MLQLLTGRVYTLPAARIQQRCAPHEGTTLGVDIAPPRRPSWATLHLADDAAVRQVPSVASPTLPWPARWRKPGRFGRDLEAFGLWAAVGVASALLLLPRGDNGLLGFPDLQPGEVAPHTVKSPRSFTVMDPVSTRENRERARASVRPVFDHYLGLEAAALARLEAAFLDADESVVGEAAPEETRRAAMSRFLTRLEMAAGDPASIAPLLRHGDRAAVLKAASTLLEGIFKRKLVGNPATVASQGRITVLSIDAEGLSLAETNVEASELSDVLGPAQARAEVDALASLRLKLPKTVRRAVARVVKDLLTTNFAPNLQETLRRKRLAFQSVKPSMIVVSRGDRLARAGERVSERDLLLLKALSRLESPQAKMQSVLGSALLGIVLGWLGFRSARHAYRHRLPKKRDWVFLASSLITFLLLVFIGFKVVEWLGEQAPLYGLGGEAYRLLLPLATISIVIRLAAGPVASAAAAPVFGLLAGWMMDGNLDYAAYTLAGTFAAASTDPGAKRIVLTAGLRAGVAQALVALGAKLLDAELSVLTAGVMVALALGSGFLSSVLARLVIPAIETLFGYTTPTGLAAFADTEHPLLRELLVEVPGTYHHAQHVGGLAEAGARAIGSDRLLARVGGYLHDVGRLGGPGSPDKRRRHAATLAVEQRFPPELAHILAEQPHEAGRNPLAHEGGPVPRSKTSALVFLADWVEEALEGREGTFEDRHTLTVRVREVSREALGRALLDAAALELRELALVEAAFVEALEPRFLQTKEQARYRIPSSSEHPPS